MKPIAVTHREDGTSEITLTRGKVTVIDTADYDLVKNYRWQAGPVDKNWYAITKGSLRMHQLICPCALHLEVDHRDRDGLNNRRKNLRPLTHSQNKHNGKKEDVGLWWEQTRGKWRVTIRVNMRLIIVGRFADKEEAIKARRAAEEQYFPGIKR
jgi:hypothetical protein